MTPKQSLRVPVSLVAAVPSFLIGFVANRYLTDMLPALVIPAAAALAVIVRPQRISLRAAHVMVAVLALWGLWVNIALATWTQNLKEPGFTELRYDIDDAEFRPPVMPAAVLRFQLSV